MGSLCSQNPVGGWLCVLGNRLKRLATSSWVELVSIQLRGLADKVYKMVVTSDPGKSSWSVNKRLRSVVM